MAIAREETQEGIQARRQLQAGHGLQQKGMEYAAIALQEHGAREQPFDALLAPAVKHAEDSWTLVACAEQQTAEDSWALVAPG